MSYDTDVSIDDIQDAHRERMRAGRHMFELLERQQDDTLRILGSNPPLVTEEDTEINRARRAVWKAEYEAFRLDPQLRYVPRDVALPPEAKEQ